MIHDILILTSYPFGKFEYDRFGVQILEEHFKVQVLDCTPWLNPQFWEKHSETARSFPGYTAIHNWAEFEQAMVHVSKGVAIDCLGNNACSKHILKAFRDHGVLRAIVHIGLIPSLHLKPWQWIKILYWHGNLVSGLFNLLLAKTRLRGHAAFPADMAVLSGEAGLKDPCAQAVHKIWAHSFDYDMYLKQRGQAGKRLKPYAVFLDEDMAYHSDFLLIGIKPPVTAEKYYPALRALFEMVERHTGLELVFAAHPRSRYDLRPHLLAGRTPVLGKTAELVRDANIVLCHNSTSISFAVLWRKPMVFLTSNQLERSWSGPRITLFSNLLQSPRVNIDCLNELKIDLQAWSRMDEWAYADYQKKYIKKPGTPELPIWEIFSDYVQKM